MSESEDGCADLSTATTDELLDELHRRCDTLYLVMKPNTPEGYDWRRSIAGDPYAAIGLVVHTVFDMLTEQRSGEAEREAEDEGEGD